MAVDNPVHQLETGEGDWKKDSAIFVDVWSRHSEQLVQVLRLAVRIGRCRGRRGRQGHGHGGLWRHRRGRGCLDVVTHQVAHLHARGRASSVLHPWLQVRTYGPLLSFVVHAQIVHFEMDSLKMEQKSRLWKRNNKKSFLNYWKLYQMYSLTDLSYRMFWDLFGVTVIQTRPSIVWVSAAHRSCHWWTHIGGRSWSWSQHKTSY